MTRAAPNFQRPLHILISGDRTEAYRWLPWAKQKVHALAAHADIGAQTYQPRADIRVQVEVTPGQKWVRIWTGKCSLYMESGVLDMLEIAPLHERTYRPAQLLFTDTIKADRGLYYPNGNLKVEEVLPGTLKGENRDEGESKAIGCNDDDKLGHLVVNNLLTGQVNTYKDATKPWCTLGDVYGKKRAQVAFPASRFTGLLQQHVQAVYGSKRNDYFVDETLGINPQVLEWTPKGWNGYGDGWFTGTGLFRGDEYRYWLIFTVTDGVYARRMNVTGCGVQLRQWLIKNDGQLSADDRRRYESYLLSTLEQDEEEGLVKIKDKAFIHPLFELGSPWWYGWHWNEDGSEGHAVLIRHKPGTSYGGADHMWQATHVRISIAEHSDKTLTLAQGRLLVGWGIEEDTQDFTMRNNEDLVWWPFPGGGMEAFVPKPLNTGNEPDIDSDVPQYCYYDDNWQLQVVRFERRTYPESYEREQVTRSDGSITGLAPFETIVEAATTCHGTHAWGVEETADTYFTYGFYIDNGLNGRTEAYENLITYSVEGFILGSAPVDLGVFNPQGNPYDRTVECNDTPWAAQVDSMSIERWQASGGELQTIVDVGVETLLVVPRSDASSAYIGLKRNWFGDPLSSGVIDGGVDAGRGYKDSGGNILATGEQTRHWLHYDREGVFNEPQFKLPAGEIPGVTTYFSMDTSGDLGVADIQVWWVHRGGDERVHESAGGKGGTRGNMYIPSVSALASPDVGPGDTGLDDIFDDGGWDELFDPPQLLITPFSQQFVAAYQSFETSARLAWRSPDLSLGFYQEDFDFSELASDYEFALVGHV